MNFVYNMRPKKPPSSNSVKTIHHHEQLSTFVNFNITNTSVNIFYSFVDILELYPKTQIFATCDFYRSSCSGSTVAVSHVLTIPPFDEPQQFLDGK